MKLADLKTVADLPLLAAELIRYHATEREGIRTADPAALVAMADAIDASMASGNSGLARVLMSVAGAELIGHSGCLRACLSPFLETHQVEIATTLGVINMRRDATEN